MHKVLRSEEHVYFVNKTSDLISVCDRVLEIPNEHRLRLSDERIRYIKEHHSVECRVDTIVSCAEVLRNGTGESLVENITNLRMPHFLPEVDVEVESQYAIRENLK